MDFVTLLPTECFACPFYAHKKAKPPVNSGLPAGEMFGIRAALDTSNISKTKTLDPHPAECETVAFISTTL